jgi:membrane-bound metal-dependent hydrolase YbcI (DUF457 family)
MVMAGSVLALLDGVTGGPWILHTLVGSVVALAVVMVATRRRRLVRRRWLGLPIGMFVHLLLDGVWTNQHLFWWPFFGSSFGADSLPELSRFPLVVVMELVGAAGLAFGWSRCGLAHPDVRRRFLRTGQLDRSVVSG